MRKLIFIFLCFLAVPCWAANETINDQTDLAAKPATDDEFVLWDTSTGVMKKVDFSYINDLKNVDDYGGLQAAVASFGATATSLLINSAQTVTDNLTVPATIQIIGFRNGSVSTNAGKTLTINGSLILPDGYQFFSGAGTTTINSTGVVQGAWTGGSTLSGMVKDEDNMASDSAAHLATQQSIKAYVDSVLSGSGVAKGWVNCGVIGNIADSFNVTSVTDVGAGQITVVWDTNFASADYVVVATVEQNTYRSTSYTSQLAGSVDILTFTSAGALSDPAAYSVVAFGDQ